MLPSEIENIVLPLSIPDATVSPTYGNIQVVVLDSVPTPKMENIMPEEIPLPKERNTPEELLTQWTVSYLKLMGWLTSFGGQTGNFGHMSDAQSATLVGMLALHVQDAKLRETLLTGIAEFVNRSSSNIGTVSRASCLLLEQSISVSTETTEQGKVAALAQLNGCKNAGYISAEEYTLLLNQLEKMRVGTVLQVPGMSPG
jgi:hypothetical protein